MSPAEVAEVKDVSLFIGLFYSGWFLECSLAAYSPYNDLNSILQMRKFVHFRPEAAEACLTSWGRHLDYLTPQLVVLSLADKRVSAEVKMEMAVKLISIEPPSVFPPQFPKCIIPNLVENASFWPENGELPSLAQLINKSSWLIFKKLNILDKVGWLQKHPIMWEEDPDFQLFASFVWTMTVVNDPAERTVKLAKDFIDRSPNEETLQNNFLVVSQHRQEFPTTSGGKMPNPLCST